MVESRLLQRVYVRSPTDSVKDPDAVLCGIDRLHRVWQVFLNGLGTQKRPPMHEKAHLLGAEVQKRSNPALGMVVAFHHILILWI